jgi:hypothetical protein
MPVRASELDLVNEVGDEPVELFRLFHHHEMAGAGDRLYRIERITAGTRRL